MTGKKRKLIILGASAGLLLPAGLLILFNLNLSALPDPGSVETFIATRGKRLVISRQASDSVPIRPAPDPRDAGIGRGLFLGSCSSCHGFDGRTPTEMGRRMYPRAVDLGSAAVQQYSDAELFWIVKNGIRLTGMPGLGDSQPDENIWRIVGFLRTLPETEPAP